MKIEFSPADLRPLVQSVVAEVLQQTEADHASLNGRIAYPEVEAASLIGCQRHVLRDLRLRGEVRASRIGKKIYYTREAILELLARNHED